MQVIETEIPAVKRVIPKRHGDDRGWFSEVYRADLLAGYGPGLDESRIPFWVLAATIRWAVIAADQGARFLSGVERTLELALTAHLLPALEWQVLQQVETLDA